MVRCVYAAPALNMVRSSTRCCLPPAAPGCKQVVVKAAGAAGGVTGSKGHPTPPPPPTPSPMAGAPPPPAPLFRSHPTHTITITTSTHARAHVHTHTHTATATAKMRPTCAPMVATGTSSGSFTSRRTRCSPPYTSHAALPPATACRHEGTRERWVGWGQVGMWWGRGGGPQVARLVLQEGPSTHPPTYPLARARTHAAILPPPKKTTTATRLVMQLQLLVVQQQLPQALIQIAQQPRHHLHTG